MNNGLRILAVQLLIVTEITDLLNRRIIVGQETPKGKEDKGQSPKGDNGQREENLTKE